MTRRAIGSHNPIARDQPPPRPVAPAPPTDRLSQADMDLQLTGRLSLVSGSTAGIGYAIAEALARVIKSAF
jgi:hypothetical protein